MKLNPHEKAVEREAAKVRVNLRFLLRRSGWQLKEVAMIAKVSERTMHSIDKGPDHSEHYSHPSFTSLIKLAEAFDVVAGDLFLEPDAFQRKYRDHTPSPKMIVPPGPSEDDSEDPGPGESTGWYVNSLANFGNLTVVTPRTGGLVVVPERGTFADVRRLDGALTLLGRCVN